jgi:hypothetical protein
LDFDKLDQNLLHLVVSNTKYFVFRPRSFALLTLLSKSLDLIGFPVVGSCSTPAANLHPSAFVILLACGQAGHPLSTSLKIVHPLKGKEHPNRYVWKITPNLNAASKTL